MLFEGGTGETVRKEPATTMRSPHTAPPADGHLVQGAHPNRAAGGVMERGIGRNYPKLGGAARSRSRRQSQRAVPREPTGTGK